MKKETIYLIDTIFIIKIGHLYFDVFSIRKDHRLFSLKLKALENRSED